MDEMDRSSTALVTSTAIPSAAVVELPLDIDVVVRAALRPQERVERIVRPKPSPKELSPMLAIVTGAPFVLGGAVAAYVAFMGMGVVAAAWAIPLFATGGIMLASPVTARYAAKRTAYVVTDQRVIAVEARAGELSVRSFDPEQLRNAKRRERPDGSGDLILGERRERFRLFDDGLIAVPDVRSVEEHVRSMAARKLNEG